MSEYQVSPAGGADGEALRAASLRSPLRARLRRRSQARLARCALRPGFAGLAAPRAQTWQLAAPPRRLPRRRRRSGAAASIPVSCRPGWIPRGLSACGSAPTQPGCPVCPRYPRGFPGQLVYARLLSRRRGCLPRLRWLRPASPFAPLPVCRAAALRSPGRGRRARSRFAGAVRRFRPSCAHPAARPPGFSVRGLCALRAPPPLTVLRCLAACPQLRCRLPALRSGRLCFVRARLGCSAQPAGASPGCPLRGFGGGFAPLPGAGRR